MMAKKKLIRVIPLSTFQVALGVVARYGVKMAVTEEVFTKLRHKFMTVEDHQTQNKEKAKQGPPLWWDGEKLTTYERKIWSVPEDQGLFD